MIELVDYDAYCEMPAEQRMLQSLQALGEILAVTEWPLIFPEEVQHSEPRLVSTSDVKALFSRLSALEDQIARLEKSQEKSGAKNIEDASSSAIAER